MNRNKTDLSCCCYGNATFAISCCETLYSVVRAELREIVQESHQRRVTLCYYTVYLLCLEKQTHKQTNLSHIF